MSLVEICIGGKRERGETQLMEWWRTQGTRCGRAKAWAACIDSLAAVVVLVGVCSAHYMH